MGSEPRPVSGSGKLATNGLRLGLEIDGPAFPSVQMAPEGRKDRRGVAWGLGAEPGPWRAWGGKAGENDGGMEVVR